MATAQRGPSEATTGRRIPPHTSCRTSCRTSTFVRRSDDPSDGPFVHSLSERSEGRQRQDDGYERRDLKDGPDLLPSRKRTVDAGEDCLFGYPRAELEQVRGRTGRREDVGQRERGSEVAKRSGSHWCALVDNESNPECDCEGWCTKA